jgi:5-formyltetrahydrofolate cyclo-ligase
LSDAGEAKRALRARAREARDHLDPEVRRIASDRIASRLREALTERPAGGILCCIPFGSEPDICPLLDAPPPGWTVYVPRTRWSDRGLDLCRYPCALAETRFGLLEPVPEVPALSDAEIDVVLSLIVIPGVAFARATHHRLGYGGGFFDRFRAEHPALSTIGVCFASQLVEELPVGAHDVPVDLLITEDGVL